ncbi:DUF262 domain-containing protein [Pseudomonas gingeri]|uniref:DUF262 domain-containing protein n=1 Tax=Pseudomonas gingeri TaxID=117681 RepID=UPI0015A35186|nr:DUF262 domain-containing protein [Pseudomonas gingeri]NWA03471.1 DUF262 domain-containing protein [Pseudomonas gingeri]NWA14329.1 DUF262 domain-containing protein [Pseudomonas gingeri]NWA55053.1 DUF262 domain-containing protein [Pseudomonas gingeri]NWA94777.1 DUF262 domain-containing protein [Pseudomonas gingeri]NWB01433.1 DUF262 domain-containing protein [Pseudomonas gingeri]
MQLNPMHLKVSALLDSRIFRIPEYQRAYSWTKKQRADLFHDIKEAFQSQREHFMATVVALARETRTIGTDEFRDVELVDGQQRITTIIILLKAIEKNLKVDSKIDSKAKREINELLIKSDEHSLVLLQTNHDSSNIFSNYIRTGETDRKNSKTIFDNNLISAADECESFVKSWESKHGLPDLISTLKNKLSLIYHEIADEATVYRVFEVLNSRGLDVKWIDKLKSQLMALIFEHVEDGTRKDAAHEMQVKWQTIYRVLGQGANLGDEALRFAGTLLMDIQPNRIVSEEDATNQLTQAAGTDLKNIMAVGKHLENVVQAVQHLHQNVRIKAVTRISHARFVAVSIILRAFDKKTTQLLLNSWEKSTFRIFELGGADTRHKVGEYVRLGYDIINEKLSAEDINHNLQYLSSDYSIKSALKNFDHTNCYNGWTEQLRYVLFRYDEHLSKEAGERLNTGQWNKIWTQDPSNSIEHILPQSSGSSHTHHLGNLCMLPPNVNSSLKDIPPQEKAATYLSCGLKGTALVGSQLTNQPKWDKKAIEKRSKEILAFIQQEWGD